MCFSPQADLAAGVIVGAVGVDAIRHVEKRTETVLASLPVLFAAHQFVEAFVWWGLSGTVAWTLGRAAMWVYLGFAFGVLPVMVPVAILVIEPDARRRHLMAPFVVIGALVDGLLISALVRGPVSVMMEPYHLAYHTGLSYAPLVTALYVLATCAPPLLSSSRGIAIFGAANLGAVTILLWLTLSGFVSLWCVWAAFTSIAIAAHLRRASRHRVMQTALS